MKICKKCGAEVNGNFCLQCGTPAPDEEAVVPATPAQSSNKFCKNCGKPVDGKFCLSCGTPVDEAPVGTAPVASASKVSADVTPVPAAAPAKKLEKHTLLGILGLGSLVVYMLISGLSAIIQTVATFYGGVAPAFFSFLGFLCMAVLIAGIVLAVVGLVFAIKNNNASPEVKRRDKIFGIVSTAVCGGVTVLLIFSSIVTAIITTVALI